MKLKSKLSLGLAGIALASGLAGCAQEYYLSFEEDIVKVVDGSEYRVISVKDSYGNIQVKSVDGTKVFGLVLKRDGNIDEVTFYNVQKGSHFDKYRDFEKLNKLVDYVDDKVKELNQPKAEAEQ